MEKGTHRESGQYWTKSCMGWAVRDYDSQTKTWTGKSIIGSLSDAVFDEIDENPITYETRIPTPDEKSVEIEMLDLLAAIEYQFSTFGELQLSNSQRDAYDDVVDFLKSHNLKQRKP